MSVVLHCHKKAHLKIWRLYQQYVNVTVLYMWHETDSVMKLTSLTSTSLCPLAACWLSLSWLCSFTTSWAAFRRSSSLTSSSASNRLTLCSYSRDRSSGMPASESFNERTLVFSSLFSSWSLATWEKLALLFYRFGKLYRFGKTHQHFVLISSDSCETIRMRIPQERVLPKRLYREATSVRGTFFRLH